MGKVQMAASRNLGGEAYNLLDAGILGTTSFTATTANTWATAQTELFDVTAYDMLNTAMIVKVNSGAIGTDRFAISLINAEGAQIDAVLNDSRSNDAFFDVRSFVGKIRIRMNISSQYSLNQTATITTAILYKLPQN